MSAAVIKILKDGKEIKSQEFNQELVLGRGDSCHLKLEDKAVSREHLIFKKIGNDVQVEKRSEFAPLIINGLETTRAILKEGDVISIGPYLAKISQNKTQPFKMDSPAPVIDLPVAVAPPPMEVKESKPQMASSDFNDHLPESTVAAPPVEPSVNPNDFLGNSQENSSIVPMPGGGVSLDELKSISIAQDQIQPQNTLPSASLEPGTPGGQLPSASSGIQPGGTPEGIPGLQLGSSGLAQLPEAAPIELNVPDQTGGEAAPQTGMFLDSSLEGTKTRLVQDQAVVVKIKFDSVEAAGQTEYLFEEFPVAVGRGSECQVILNDKKSSRKHILIEKHGSAFVVRDLKSANGTTVNGQPITEHTLSSGDIIQIGDTPFVFEALSKEFAEKNAALPETPPVEEVMQQQTQIPDFHAPLAFGGLGTQPGIAPPGSQEANPSPIPGIDAPEASTKEINSKKGLFEKINAMPPRKRIVYVLTIVTALYLAFFDEDAPQPVKLRKPASSQNGTLGDNKQMTFALLPADKKRFVEAQHQLAFDYYKNREYDKALFELEKIFAIIPDYKDSKEIERYAKDGKRKLEAMEEERRKREEEQKLKAKIAQLIDQTRAFMQKKQYEKAKTLFSEILALDPDHPVVREWQKEIGEFEEVLQQQAQRKQIEKEINQSALGVYRNGLTEYRQGRYLSSISTFKKVLDIQVTDPSIHRKSKEMIYSAAKRMDELREPLLQQAKELETAGDFIKSYDLYSRASKIDPRHSEGRNGMNRIRSILNEKAKILYTEGVLAESYSDFDVAKQKFEEITKTVPVDDIYFERAKLKLRRYFHLRNIASEPKASSVEAAPAPSEEHGDQSP